MTHKKIITLVAVLAVMGVVAFGTQTLVNALDSDTSVSSPNNRQTVMDKRSELKQKFADMKEARTAKLDAKRLEICEKRQQTINDIITRGVERNTKHLAFFQKIETNVKQFYVNKHLSSDKYAAAVEAADTAEANAATAIDASADVKFDCNTTDGNKPGSVIKEAMESRHSALVAYRTSIKDLIVIVKKANGEQKSANQTTPSTNGVKE